MLRAMTNENSKFEDDERATVLDTAAVGFFTERIIVINERINNSHIAK